MSLFHALIVEQVTQETHDCVSISFNIPTSLQQLFLYKQGQYITFKLLINEEEVRRSYSICSSPLTDNLLSVAIKRVKDGKGSVYLTQKVKAGDKLEVMVPMGNFYTTMQAANQKEYVLFAGGSGITPMLSIIKTVLKAEPQSKIQLFYGNQDEQSIIFKQQLLKLENENGQKLKVHHILDNPSGSVDSTYKGIMTVEKVKELLQKFVPPNSSQEYFICGPTPMMQNVEKVLNEKGIIKDNIHLEYFTAPVDDSKQSVNANVSKGASLTIILDGDEIVTQMEPDETILEAALRLNLDAPYACQGGSCCTCRALLISGKVEMKVNYALLDAEVREGFILTCQSQPTSNEVKVDYDRGR